MITIDQQINCLKKEIERKKKVMPKLIEAGRASDESALYEIECMSAAMRTLTQLKGMVATK